MEYDTKIQSITGSDSEPTIIVLEGTGIVITLTDPDPLEVQDWIVGQTVCVGLEAQ